MLTCALFPQVAAKFLAARAEGPKNVGKDPAAKPVAPAAANGKLPISTPVTYDVRVGDKVHKVSVTPV